MPEEKETDPIFLMLHLPGIAIVSIIAFRLLCDTVPDAGLVILTLIVGGPLFLSYSFLAIFGLPYDLRAIRRNIQRPKAIFYAIVILAIPFGVLYFSWDYLLLASGISGSVFLWSLLSVEIADKPRKRKSKRNVF